MHPPQPGLASTPELIRCVEHAAMAPPNPVASALVAALSSDFGSHLLGVVFYGSRLNRTAGPRSHWDFFVVVDGYRAVHRGWMHAWLNALLPPSVYRREVTLDDGSTESCKLSLVSSADLARYTSSSAPDSYLFGRLSKRVALVFARDDLVRRGLVEALARSVVLCAEWTLAGASESIGPERLAQESVAFSYRCEERVEGPSRARDLFAADAAYFLQVYERAVEALAAAGRVQLDAMGLAARTRSAAQRRDARAEVMTLVRRSRRRARLRWLKNVLTFDGWDEYMLAKIERHQGETIALSERERRHPLLAAVRHYLRLRRAGRLWGTSSKGADLPCGTPVKARDG